MVVFGVVAVIGFEVSERELEDQILGICFFSTSYLPFGPALWLVHDAGKQRCSCLRMNSSCRPLGQGCSSDDSAKSQSWLGEGR